MNSEIDRKIAVILVADVVGYSKHMERDEHFKSAKIQPRDAWYQEWKVVQRHIK